MEAMTTSRARAPALRACGEDGQSVLVVRLVDLVAEVAEAKGLPDDPAVAAVVDALLADSAPVLLAESPRSWAKLVGPDVVWRKAEAACHVQTVDPSQGLVIDLGRLVWEKRPARPELRGGAGALRLFQEYATDDTGLDGVRGEDAGPMGCVAVTRADAERLFPELAPTRSFWEAPEAAGPVALAAPAEPLRLVPPQGEPSAEDTAALRERIAQHKAMSKNGRTWPDKPAMLAELLRQYEERMHFPDAAADICEEKVGEVWAMKKNTVHVYLTEARQARARVQVEAPASKRA